ncbi:MAG TPA: VWA domain-containing protein [Lacibacter sp.]|nr:VWA domain-containing protein [Lacibacter sp.]HMO88130.1 VWA domain-containing protein [Lacibacter sp.]HMP87988.1 VWA domain-containing protein [Lacibacter sp.]
MPLSFAHTEYLLLLLLLLPAGWWIYRNLQWKQKVRRQLGDTGLVEQLTAGYSHKRYRWQYRGLLAGCCLLILALAQPRLRGTGEAPVRSGRDVLVVLDVSRSMLATDVKPSRLEKAKQFVARLSDRLTDDRTGLLLFAGNAYLAMPLTADQGAVRLFLQAATPDAVPLQGTVIGQALTLAAQSFPRHSSRHQIVVLLTDGEDHDATAMEAATALREQGIQLLVLGLGTAEGAQLVDPATGGQKKDRQGQVVVSKLNEPLLREMAAAAGGMYGNLQQTDVLLQEVVEVVEQFQKKAAAGETATAVYLPLFPWLLALALVLLVAATLLPERKATSQAEGRLT